MISLSITVDDDIIVAYQELFRDLPKLSQRAFRGEITRVTRPMLDELTATPGPPQYPIRWKSERQRRAFFASNGFGRGIPTQRSGALQEAWSVEVVGGQFDMDVLVDNDLPYAQYVQGDDQQPFHADTGWPLAAPIVDRYSELVGDALINTWFSIVEFQGK